MHLCHAALQECCDDDNVLSLNQFPTTNICSIRYDKSRATTIREIMSIKYYVTVTGIYYPLRRVTLLQR